MEEEKMVFFEFCSNIVEGLSGVAHSIGSAIKGLCESLSSEAIAEIGCIAAAILIPGVGLPELLLVINSIADIVLTISKILGINQTGDSAEELGMKVEQADKKPEDFDSIEEYITYLNNEITLDDNKVENLSDEEKAKYATMGIGINVLAIQEKYGDVTVSPEFLMEVSRLKMTGEQVKNYIDSFKESGIQNMQDMTDYLKGKDTVAEKSSVSDSIINGLEKNYPGLEKEELEEKLESLRME